jgi:hypothetical protein
MMVRSKKEALAGSEVEDDELAYRPFRLVSTRDQDLEKQPQRFATGYFLLDMSLPLQ